MESVTFLHALIMTIIFYGVVQLVKKTSQKYNKYKN